MLKILKRKDNKLSETMESRIKGLDRRANLLIMISKRKER